MTESVTTLPTGAGRFAGRFISQVVAAFSYCAIPFGAPIDPRVIARIRGQQSGASPDAAASVAAVPVPRAGEQPAQLRATPQSAFAEH